VGDELAPLGILGRVPEAEGFPPEARAELYVALLAAHPGEAADGERVVQPLRELGEPIVDLSRPMRRTEAQAMLDEDYPHGWRYYWKSVNLPELGDDVIQRLVEHASAAPSPHSTIDVWYQGGALARIDEQATAFANRGEPYLVGIEGNWAAESASEENVAWVREIYADMRSRSRGGVYLNFPGFLDEGERLLRDGYGANYERLEQLKAKDDPTNLFHLNANIEPNARPGGQ
jgi:FAD/FMN-containing dehydrogenase